MKMLLTENNNGSARYAGRQGRIWSAGFTLIELMIVVAIVAILAAVAYPSYTSYITKTRRVAAEGCLSEIANYMERYYTTNLAYHKDGGGTANPYSLPDCASAQRTGADYSYPTPTTWTGTTYSITAVPRGAQAARDTKCGTLSLNEAGNRSAGGSGCW